MTERTFTAARYCPQCGKRLERVYQDSNSMLNEYQFDAVKAGDWFCKSCPSNDRGQAPNCYWWDRETVDADVALTAASEREAALREEVTTLRELRDLAFRLMRGPADGVTGEFRSPLEKPGGKDHSCRVCLSPPSCGDGTFVCAFHGLRAALGLSPTEPTP